MDTKTQQQALNLDFPCPNDGVDINGRVWYRDVHERRAVFVGNTPFYVFDRNNEVEYRFCAVQLVEAELATVAEICSAFDIPCRTFSRIRKLVRQGGIAALVKDLKGRRARTQKSTPAIVRKYQEGESTYKIASLLGISPATVRRVLKDEGIPLRGNNGKPLFSGPEQDGDAAETQSALHADELQSPAASVEVQQDHETVALEVAEETSPQTNAVEPTEPELTRPVIESSTATCTASPTSAAASLLQPVPSDHDHDHATTAAATLFTASVDATSIPYASLLDRVSLRLGLIDEAPVRFESVNAVSGAGAMLGLALLGENGLLEEARGVYGRLQKCWYGLRPMVWLLLVMAWLRIKRPEQIKHRDPTGLGHLLGLPRAAEVKTIRRKMQELAARGQAAELHRRMAKRRAEEHEDELFRLYIDGHVRVYFGKRRIGKAYVTRLNSRQRAETDYWVHSSSGQPLLVVRDSANESFTSVMREQVLPEIRRVIGKRRVRVVFDRGGWCKELFQLLLDEGFDFMTYRCHPYDWLDNGDFQTVTLEVEGQTVKYELAEDKFDEEGWPPLRLVAVKRKDGGQTHIVASGRETWEWMGQEVEDAEPPVEELVPRDGNRPCLRRCLALAFLFYHSANQEGRLQSCQGGPRRLSFPSDSRGFYSRSSIVEQHLFASSSVLALSCWLLKRIATTKSQRSFRLIRSKLACGENVGRLNLRD